MCGSSLNDTRPQPLEAVGTASSSGDSRNGYDVSGMDLPMATHYILFLNTTGNMSQLLALIGVSAHIVS